MPIHSRSPGERRRARFASSAFVLVLFAAACDMSEISGVGCVGCPATTRLDIQGDSVVNVGDAIVLRAVAFQETILFDVRHLPMRDAVWTSSIEGPVDLVVPRPVNADTATWGRAVLIGRAPGTARVTARADGREATKLVRVIATP